MAHSSEWKRPRRVPRVDLRAAASAGLVAIVCAMIAGACPAPSFREYGPRERAPGGGGVGVERRAWPRPHLEVSPPEVLAGRPGRFAVLEHASRGGLHVLVLEPEAGDDVEVRYRVADGLRLPIEAGERLWFNQSSDGVGLAVRDGEGAPRAVISVDGALSEVVEGLITPAFVPERLAFSEASAEPSGCLTMLDHHELEVRRGQERIYAAPGTTLALTVPTAAGERTMRLYALDASRPTPRRQERDDSRCTAAAHVSWVLVAAGAP